jgi:hypothetical protein
MHVYILHVVVCVISILSDLMSGMKVECGSGACSEYLFGSSCDECALAVKRGNIVFRSLFYSLF